MEAMTTTEWIVLAITMAVMLVFSLIEQRDLNRK